MFQTLNNRSLEIFKQVVDAYLETGAPIGSQTLAKRMGMHISSATIRNVMARLEEVGLLYAPHTSAGRLPTEAGLKYFVHGLLEVGDLPEIERRKIEEQCRGLPESPELLLKRASLTLSGLSDCAGLVIAPKGEACLKHIEFVYLQEGEALVVLVTDDGNIENRLIKIPRGFPPSQLVEATNFMNAHYMGRTLEEVKMAVVADMDAERGHLNGAIRNIVESGLATWVEGEEETTLILNGHSNLLSDIQQIEDLESIKRLFHILDTKEAVVQLLDASIQGDGIQIFIGAESNFFQVSGCSVIMSPYKNKAGKLLGSLGVIGPSRLNYSRIIPMVDYTAKVIGRLLG